jgi:hypothetical protein
MVNKIEPVPGDPSTEPVATALQSHVAGRVGPPTIAQDATTPELSLGVTQIEPGTVLPEDQAWAGPVVEYDETGAPLSSPDAVPGDDVPQSQSNGPVKNEHPTSTKSDSKS